MQEKWLMTVFWTELFIQAFFCLFKNIRIHFYADKITPSMERAMRETERRREKQDAYNKANGIVPKTVIKSVRDVMVLNPEEKAEFDPSDRQLTKQQRAELIFKLEKQMKEAAKMLEFEVAAALRDQIIQLRGQDK